MTLTPSVDFTKYLVIGSSAVPNGISPIAVDPLTLGISCAPCSSINSGIVTVGAQSIAGIKTFSDLPVCSIAPTSLHQLANKQYVDNLIAVSQTFLAPIEAFHDLTVSDPPGAVLNDRYISTGTDGTFTANRIYKYVSPASYIEQDLPEEGDVLYDKDTDKTYLFTQAGIWTNLSISLVHNQLENSGTVTHAQLDTMYSTSALANINSIGFLDSTSGITMGYTTGTRLFTITMTADVSFLSNGAMVTLTSGTTKQLILGASPLSDTFYMYLDENGDLVYQATLDNYFTMYCSLMILRIENDVLISASDFRYLTGDINIRYAGIMKSRQHIKLNDSGLFVTLYPGTGVLAEHGQYSCTAGYTIDQDQIRTFLPVAAGDSKRVYYHDSATGRLAFKTTESFACLNTTRIFTQKDAAAIVDVPNTFYAWYHVWAIPYANNHYPRTIVGRDSFSSIDLADAALLDELNSIFNNVAQFGALVQNGCYIGSILAQGSTSYANIYKCRGTKWVTAGLSNDLVVRADGFMRGSSNYVQRVQNRYTPVGPYDILRLADFSTVYSTLTSYRWFVAGDGANYGTQTVYYSRVGNLRMFWVTALSSTFTPGSAGWLTLFNSAGAAYVHPDVPAISYHQMATVPVVHGGNRKMATFAMYAAGNIQIARCTEALGNTDWPSGTSVTVGIFGISMVY